MEDEIDLRPYFGALLSHWPVLLGGAVLGGLVAFLLATLLPPAYRATALVAVLEPAQRVQFDPRIQDARNESQLIEAFPELARSDELLSALMETLDLPDIVNIPSLKSKLSAEPGKDPGLLRLRAEHSDPTTSALMANSWAELFVSSANEVYGNQSSARLQYFESQLAEAEQRLETADKSLIAFEAENRLTLINNELESLLQLQVNYLGEQRSMIALEDDIFSLRQQQQSDTVNALPLAQQLTALALQAKAYGIQNSLPLELQISADTLIDQTPDQLDAFLAALDETVIGMMSTVEQRLAEVDPDILELQALKQELEAQSERLNRDREVFQETYVTLVRQVDEEKITRDDTTSGIQLASHAAIPVIPSGPGRLLTTVVGAALGLAIAAFGTMIFTWLRN